MLVLLLSLLLLLLRGNVADFVDNQPLQSIAPADSSNPCATIQNGQVICLDCQTLAYCIQEDGNWETRPYSICPTDKSLYCDEQAKGCTYRRECRFPSGGFTFECQNAGMYPNPYDCRSYYSCSSSNQQTRYNCPSGRAYSVADKDCTLFAANNDICKNAQYECRSPYDAGAWPGDENIYYVCQVKTVNGNAELYPTLYRCSSGKVFDELTLTCINAGASTPSWGACTAGKLVPHESNCRAYYSCVNGKKVYNDCPTNTYFNSKYEACQFGSC